MLATQNLLNILNQIKEISNLDLALCLLDGSVMVSTFEFKEDLSKGILEFVSTEANTDEDVELDVLNGYHFFRILVEENKEYVLVTYGDELNIFKLGKMAANQIQNVMLSQSEDYDRNSFIQNVLLGNMLTVDMHAKAKRLHIEENPRVIFVIDTGNKSTDYVMELVKNLSDLRAGDFVTTVDEHSVVLIKDVSDTTTDREERLEEIAKSLVDNIHMEAMVKIRVGYGNVVTQIPELSASFQEAKMALQVGRVFYAEKDTISYSKLGIGRLIYQLPMSLCDMFIKEVFGDQIPEILEDEEAMSTISKFFENNLNISETARQLYVHRNTLVYRLERIENAIGLDIRKFDDAMTFRIAIMVLAHVKDIKKQ